VIPHTDEPAAPEDKASFHDPSLARAPDPLIIDAVSPRSDVSMSPAELHSFLEPARNGILSTLSADGWPHLTAMWFVPHARELRMWAYRKSQKVVNARRDPRGAFLVEDGSTYDELRGIYVKSTISLVTDTDEVEAIGRALYDRYTYPRIGIAVDDGPIVEIKRQAAKRVGIVMVLDDVASWDHSKLAGG
jgi:hypothetical protein